MILSNINPYKEPSFSFKNRMYRLVWSIIQNTIFKYSPRNFHIFRKYILILFGAKIGENTNIYNLVRIWSPKNLIIGNNVGIANNVYLYNIDIVTIEDFVSVSEGSFLCTGSHDYNLKNFQLISKPIYIERYAWLCAECFIHPGVKIKKGCVVGARAVVTKSLINDYEVVSGNPAKTIKKRIISK